MRRLVVLILLLAPCTAMGAIDVVPAFPLLTFSRPVDIQNAGDGSNRLFIVEQSGIIRVIENHPSTSQSKIFLNITGPVSDIGSEMGLLGLAFHPQYPDSGYFYVNYTATPGNSGDPARTVVSRFSVSGTNPDSAVASSEFVMLEFDQPFFNHNGGQLAFGDDGYLYIAAGDGGSGGDPNGNGQNRMTLLGSLLRIDVDTRTDTLDYGIPPTNPFVGNMDGYREEIYAYGFRNPWRFSFDPLTGWLWLGDVGQGMWEEIDVVELGLNYGWNTLEGSHCYNAQTCDSTGLELPVWEYDHPQFAQRSVTGGHVYRGALIPELAGKYVFADYITGEIWALTYDGMSPAMNDTLMDAPYTISCFGVDEAANLFLCDYSNGRVMRFVPVTTGAGDRPPSHTGYQLRNHPNPFGPVTTVSFELDAPSSVTIEIFDVRGRRVRALASRRFAAGPNSITWNGNDDRGARQATGIYFCRLTVDGETVATRRMVLVR